MPSESKNATTAEIIPTRISLPRVRIVSSCKHGRGDGSHQNDKLAETFAAGHRDDQGHRRGENQRDVAVVRDAKRHAKEQQRNQFGTPRVGRRPMHGRDDGDGRGEHRAEQQHIAEQFALAEEHVVAAEHVEREDHAENGRRAFKPTLERQGIDELVVLQVEKIEFVDRDRLAGRREQRADFVLGLNFFDAGRFRLLFASAFHVVERERRFETRFAVFRRREQPQGHAFGGR